MLAIILVTLLSQLAHAQQTDGTYSEDEALTISQAAIDQALLDLEFTDGTGQLVRLTDYAGKPLLISLIFTSCHHVCPTLTKHLKTAVGAAREALGNDSFNVVTIGFDTANDSPQRMQDFANKQGINEPNWVFLSSSAENMAKLTENLGFIYFTSPSGFDHITQLTIVDRDGIINTQVYGGAFELPWLVEPLKDLVLNRPQSEHNFFSRMVDKVNLFCTVYDPNTGRYHYDYSLFVQIGIGGLAILSIFAWLFIETRRARRKKQAG
ncbi:MAG: SCO family protein [Xanthomonadales bacterium]|nr:SCO family protein [Xanthomonadales bacterium]